MSAEQIDSSLRNRLFVAHVRLLSQRSTINHIDQSYALYIERGGTKTIESYKADQLILLKSYDEEFQRRNTTYQEFCTARNNDLDVSGFNPV